MRILLACFMVLFTAHSGWSQSQQLEPKGELHIYQRESQDGTVGYRRFKDDKKRIVKVIYYTQDDPVRPFREDLLRERSIHTFDYDENSCLIKTNSYAPGMSLRRVEEIRCFEGTAKPKLTTVRDSLGVRQRETRHTATGGSQTVLSFGSNGEKIVSIRGLLPTDVDLADGWGDLFSGFALGISANREKGRQQDLQVHLTIKNVSHDADVSLSPIKLEVKDMFGRVFEQTANPNNGGLRYVQSGGCPSCLQQVAPRPGMTQGPFGYNLGGQFEKLASGQYSLTLTYCVTGVTGQMVSNTIVVEVE